MSKPGWYGHSPEHSLAARGIKLKSNAFERGTFLNGAVDKGVQDIAVPFILGPIGKGIMCHTNNQLGFPARRKFAEEIDEMSKDTFFDRQERERNIIEAIKLHQEGIDSYKERILESFEAGMEGASNTVIKDPRTYVDLRFKREANIASIIPLEDPTDSETDKLWESNGFMFYTTLKLGYDLSDLDARRASLLLFDILTDYDDFDQSKLTKREGVITIKPRSFDDHVALKRLSAKNTNIEEYTSTSLSYQYNKRLREDGEDFLPPQDDSKKEFVGNIFKDFLKEGTGNMFRFRGGAFREAQEACK